VQVDGTAVHTIDYTDGLPHDERARRTIEEVRKVVREVGNSCELKKCSFG